MPIPIPPTDPQSMSGDASDPIPAESTSDMNTVCLGDQALQGKADGDQVEFTGTGTVTEEGGKRYVSIDSIDGDPVSSDDAQAGDTGSIEDAAAALKSNISAQGGYNNAQ